jgi:glycosyltransferase involved in cell wall biosynthesis
VRVEVITPDADPNRGGFGARVHGLVRMLSQFAEVDVTLTSALGAPPLPRVTYRNEPVVDTRRSRLRRFRTYYKTDFPERHVQGDPDLVIVESLEVVGMNQSGDRVPFILDEHNVEWEVLRYEMGNAPFFRTWLGRRALTRRLLMPGLHTRATAYEVGTIRSAAATFVPSEIDRRRIVEALPDTAERVRVLPSCLDLERYPPIEETETATGVVFVASYNYVPNQEAARFIDATLAPSLPAVQFLLVGGHLPSGLARSSNVVPLGFVADLAEPLSRASVCIAPIWRGSGTRLKILTYLAARKAVVATTKACEGLDVIDGVHLLIRDDPKEFQSAVSSLLADRPLRQRLGSAGRALIESKYDWRGYVPRLREWVQDAIRSAPTSETSD